MTGRYYQVDGRAGDLVAELKLGGLLVLTWESSPEPGHRERWQSYLQALCVEADIPVRFGDIPRKSLTIAYNAANEPPFDRVVEFLHRIEYGRFTHTPLPSKQDVLRAARIHSLVS